MKGMDAQAPPRVLRSYPEQFFILFLLFFLLVFLAFLLARREYITKSLPEFYDPILEHSKTRGLKSEDLWLLDDSPANLKASGDTLNDTDMPGNISNVLF